MSENNSLNTRQFMLTRYIYIKDFNVYSGGEVQAPHLLVVALSTTLRHEDGILSRQHGKIAEYTVSHG